MTAVKGFEESRNRDKQRNIQYLLHKDFAIKANRLENGFRKGCEENNFVLQKKKAFRKIIFFASLRKI